MTTPEPADVAIRRRRPLGVGLRADLISPRDIGRDISLATTEAGTDLAMVDGFDNLCQDLAVGLSTLRGSDVFNQRFGFLGLSALTTQTSPVLAREGVRAAVAEFLAGDPRVREITDVQLVNPMSDPSGAGRRTLAVRVSFDAITGESASISGVGVASGAAWGAVETTIAGADDDR
ncbi:hypothetical protein [Mycobacterium sp.]|uniref:hypothetical protein n=1 Tax=Mycobacterium sp. TaxID=1785 RepID=UPI003D13B9A6